ncbi:hypothetical protein GGR88_002637 [Sphingomonas jejuensis]|uniref:Uncharacterized protein n=2 Tax=Sphingomonas jejuensis TaxID=904715 RepID=A0ABX0XPH7_9SPHN|nr:hypothetical protein [Sphingomonas jejuensis]
MPGENHNLPEDEEERQALKDPVRNLRVVAASIVNGWAVGVAAVLVLTVVTVGAGLGDYLLLVWLGCIGMVAVWERAHVARRRRVRRATNRLLGLDRQ